MRQGVPLLAGGAVGGHHLLARGQLLHIGQHELRVEAGTVAAGRDVLPGEIPILMQHLALEAAEDRLDALGRRVVRGGRTGHPGNLLQELPGIRAARAALVIEHQLHRQEPGALHRIAAGLIHALEILHLADIAADQALAERIHNLVGLQTRGLIALTGHILLVIQIDLRTVTVPHGITAAGHDGIELAREQRLGGQLALLGVLPLHHHLRTLQELQQRIDAPQRLPPLPGALGIVLVIELLDGIDRSAGPLHRNDPAAGRGGDLRGIGVGQLAGHQAAVALPLVLAHLLPQAGDILRQCMAVLIPQPLAALIDSLPVHRC